MEIQDPGTPERSNDRNRRSLALNLSGLAFLLWVFVAIIAFEGKFSAGLLMLALLLTGGAIVAGMGWRLRNSQIALIGAVSIVGLIMIGFFDIL